MNPIAAILLLASACASGQRIFNPADPHDEFKPSVMGLAERLAASEYVVVGTVVKVEAPFTRAFAQQLAEIDQLEKAGRVNDVLEKSQLLKQEVSLFYSRIRVDSSLCRQADFFPGSAPANPPSVVHLFNPSLAPFDAGYRNELLQPGRRYLLFLTRPADLEAKLDKFDLDREQTYYEILGHSDGAVELPSDGDKGKRFKPAGYNSDKDIATPILKAAAALCEAVQPTNLFQKLDALERLKSSPDLSMRENADTAIKLLRTRP